MHERSTGAPARTHPHSGRVPVAGSPVLSLGIGEPLAIGRARQRRVGDRDGLRRAGN